MAEMVSAVESPWLKMQEGLRTYSQMLFLFQVGVFLLAVVSLFLFALRGQLDVTWIFLVFLVLALQGLRRFCEGAMERLRHLSELV